MKLKNVVVLLLCMVQLLAVVNYAIADSFNVDMENTGVCTMTTSVLVRPQDVYNIYAQPPLDGRGTRDRCTVKFVGEGGQRFKLYVRDLQFGECQIFVKVYDGDMFLNQARYKLGCNSGQNTYLESYNSDIAISLEKPDSASTNYKFYMRLALVNGPDVGGESLAQSQSVEPTLTAGALAGVIIAGVLVALVLVAVGIYCLIVYRRKKEEKELAMSHSNLTFQSQSHKDGNESVHSSRHSTHSTHVTTRSNPVFQYPAHRSTLMSISGKQPECNSIETQSFDSGTELIKGKSVAHEFESMKRNLIEIEETKRHQAEQQQKYDTEREKARQHDSRGRNERQKGFGRSNTRRDDQVVLNADNIRASLVSAREKGRSFDDRDGHGHRSRAGSTRSNRSKHKSRSVESASDRYDYHDDRDRSRSKTRSNGGRSGHRSTSTGSTSRRTRYYNDRDAYSEDDLDSRRDNYRHRADSQGHRHNGDAGTQRSRGHRARSSSTDSRRRGR